MARQNNYKKTLTACYLGFVTQAISANFAPLLFLTFKSTYGITLEKIAIIPMVFYLAQLLIDLAATKFADKIGYRTCVVASQVLSAAGLAAMAFLPDLLSLPFVGILISVVLYAIGSGLTEVLVSPIVEACPFENKDGMMSLLHSFYCWGALGVVLGSTLFFAVFGIEHWRVLTLIWALVPLYNTWNFISCPIERLVEAGKSMRIRQLLRLPLFWLIIILMICSGASEATMAQWASAFTRVCPRRLQSGGRSGRPRPVRHVYGHIPYAVRQIQRETSFDQGYADLRRNVYRLLSAGFPVRIPHSRPYRLCSLRFGCRHYVAGFYQHLFPEMPERRYCDVRIPGPGRRFGRYRKSCHGRQSF